MGYRRSAAYDEESEYADYAGSAVCDAAADARVDFIRKTYLHVAGAILLFGVLEAILINMGMHIAMFRAFAGSGRWGPLVLFGLFMGATYLGNYWATRGGSRGMQYLGLLVYTLAEVVIFLPLIGIAVMMSQEGGGMGYEIVASAGLITLLLVAGLTATAFISGADFSFLGGALIIGSFIAFGLILASLLFGFNLGIWFSGAMCLLAGGSILYTTSNIQRRYRTDQYVAASLALFASVMLLFYYVLRILIALNRR